MKFFPRKPQANCSFFLDAIFPYLWNKDWFQNIFSFTSECLCFVSLIPKVSSIWKIRILFYVMCSVYIFWAKCIHNTSSVIIIKKFFIF
jgi:hypothetical protein